MRDYRCSFWDDAVGTSTLDKDTTPYEMVHKQKPDMSHIQVWGCQCWIQVPEETRRKFGDKMIKGIFLGYEENCIGWRVCDIHGTYHFSDLVVFNESLSGRLGGPKSVRDLGLSLGDTPRGPCPQHTIRLME